MKKYLKKSIAVFISILMLMTAFVPAAYASADWIDESLLYTDRFITASKEYNLVGGSTERYVVFNNADKSNQIKGYIMEVDLNDPDTSVIAYYNDGDTDGYARSTVRSQAASAEAKLGVNVIGAVNGGRYNTTTGEISGLYVRDGVIGNTSQGFPFFAILKDGTAVIRDGAGRTDDVAEAVSGMAILVVDGEIVSPDDVLHPRTAVGIKADGSLVFLIADGRQSPDSCGMNYHELAAAMLAMGCVNAMALDGGGSSTLLTQRESSTELELRNSPSYGFERTVGTSLLICSSAESTGVFDHVTFTESEYQVAPLSYVSFGYGGVDTNGFAVDIPANGYVELADDSYGSISGSKFYAKSKQGTTTLNYVIDGEVVGSATIVVTDEADSFLVAFFKEIQQMFANIKNLFEFFLQKVGLS